MIFAKNFARNCEKKNSRNIRRLVAGSFVQTNQRPSIIYYRLMDFGYQEQQCITTMHGNLFCVTEVRLDQVEDIKRKYFELIPSDIHQYPYNTHDTDVCHQDFSIVEKSLEKP